MGGGEREREVRTHPRAHSGMHTHARTDARTHTHTYTHKHTQTEAEGTVKIVWPCFSFGGGESGANSGVHTSKPGEQPVSLFA